MSLDTERAVERRTGRYRFPGPDASESEVREFQSRHFNVWATFRVRHLSRIARNIYYNLGRQWIELDTPTMIEGSRGYTFREQAPDNDVELPMPVTNIVAPAVDVEFATLSKRQWIPKVPSFSRDPRIQASAKVADDVLKDRLTKLDWPDLRDRFILDLIIMGTATIRSFWEESFYETMWVAVPEPYRCLQCEALFASNTVNAGVAELAFQGGDIAAAGAVAEDIPDVSFDHCPRCQGELAPTELSEHESHRKDAYDRPLGSKIPKGGTALELVTPFEYYPENSGVGCDATTERPKIHGVVKVRSLDWVEEHHPELINEVEAEDPVELMREHPLLGEWDIVGRYDSSMDSGIYDHHVRVYDMIAEPCMRFPDGRFVRVIGQNQAHIPVNDVLVRRIKGADGKEVGIPVQSIQSAVWKPRGGEFWGKALPDDLISVQNRINGIDAQTIEARERMGSPNLMVPADANLQGPEYRSGYGGGKIFYWDPSPIAPDQQPEVFGSTLMPSGVWQERNASMEDSTRIIGPADIESGEAPRNITTTSGLQILGEQAERRRATRERGVTTVFQKTWEHQLKMLWTLRLDLDTYEAENPDGSWEIKQYDRQALTGMTKVEIERQAYIDQSILIRESTREALTDQLYDPSTPHARKKLLELMGLPTDVNEDSNLQIDHAKRQWVDFVDERTIPVIDPSVDDPGIRYAVLGVYFMQEEGQRLSEEALWPQILPHIAGWEAFLEQLQINDALVRAKYGQFIAQEDADQLYAKAMLEYEEARAAHEQSMASAGEAMQAGMPPSAPQPPPEEPPKPIFMPKQPEHQVYGVWQQMLETTGALVPIMKEAVEAQTPGAEMMQPEQIAEIVDTYMRFRAVFEAYRIMGIPPPVPGVPGEEPEATGQAPPGMEEQGPAPTSGSPPMPGTPVG